MKRFMSLRNCIMAVSLVMNVWAVTVFYSWVNHLFVIRENIKRRTGKCPGDFITDGFRSYYADNTIDIVKRPKDGRFYFLSHKHDDKLCLGLTYPREGDHLHSNGIERVYLILARDFFVTWGYDATNKCVNVSLQYNDQERWFDKYGDGTVRKFRNNPFWRSADEW